MKIGYDAKRAFLNNTGLGNYSRWLIKSTAEQYPDHTYLLYTPKLRPNKWRDVFKSFGNIKTVLPVGKVFISYWRSKGIVKDLQRDGVDVYHGLSHELPRGIEATGIKSVVTVHDLIFMRFPQYFGLIDRLIYASKLKYACRVADRIIAISERTKQDLIELLHVDADKIAVIAQSCAPEIKAAAPLSKLNNVRARYGLPKQFILTVGTIEPRKNLLLLAQALGHMRSQLPVVVVGKPTAYLNEVKAYLKANDLEGRMLFLHNVTFDDLPSVYRLSRLFVYPSRYEGFGIPVLEALVSGVPVIAASGSCLEEAGGPGSRYVSPDDPAELAAQADLVLSDDALRSEMIKSGLQYAERFKDATLAAQLMNVYQQLNKHA